jgi:hypothetical protein
MLGILLLIGPMVGAWNFFWRLAEKHARSRYGYALLGLGVYIGALVVSVASLWLLLEKGGYIVVTTVWGDLASVAAPCIFTAIVYFLLKRSWERDSPREGEELLDSEP